MYLILGYNNEFKAWEPVKFNFTSRESAKVYASKLTAGKKYDTYRVIEEK